MFTDSKNDKIIENDKCSTTRTIKIWMVIVVITITDDLIVYHE